MEVEGGRKRKMEVEGGRRGKKEDEGEPQVRETREMKGGTGKEDGVRSAIEESSDLGSV